MNETLPPWPLTLEGAALLHQICATGSPVPDHPGSAAYRLVGRPEKTMLVHFRDSMAELSEIPGCDAEYSYVSVVELGLYESTMKFYAEMKEKAIVPGSPEWDAAAAETLDRQRKAMHSRLYPAIPDSEYVCFYPMNRKRDVGANWYSIPIDDRARMMHEHGLNGRRYAGRVKQVISGSIGFEEWEWGVDLFAADPLDFKRLIYEMRFDEVSAVYAEFGPFFVGRRLHA
ncbi:MAG: chlorite dismutase family protein [Bryobacteraceae bacterium]|nr:chlorite dismutase family protein [Bryobacteraceae bacterium]